MQTVQQIVDAFTRCKSYDSISLEAGSAVCLLRSQGVSVNEIISKLRLVKAALRSRDPSYLLLFADMRIDDLIGSLSASSSFEIPRLAEV